MTTLGQIASEKKEVWVLNPKGIKAKFDPQYVFTNKLPFYIPVFFPLSGRMEYWHKDTPITLVKKPELKN